MKRFCICAMCLVLLLSLCSCGPTKTVATCNLDVSGMEIIDQESYDTYGTCSPCDIDVSSPLIAECLDVLRSDGMLDAVAETYALRDGVPSLSAADIAEMLSLTAKDFVYESGRTGVRITVSLSCAMGLYEEESLLGLCQDYVDTALAMVEQTMDQTKIALLSPFDPVVEFVDSNGKVYAG